MSSTHHFVQKIIHDKSEYTNNETMGNYLKKPVEKETCETGAIGGVKFVANQIQGWRQAQEDVIITGELYHRCAFFAIADGHAGIDAALLLKENLKQHLVDLSTIRALYANKTVSQREVEEEVSSMCDEIDWKMWKEGITGGTTANVVIVTEEKLIFINIGDTKGIMVRNNEVAFESVDHKPESQIENNRILATGGFVKNGRINAKLNVSRAFGDFRLKMNKTPLSIFAFQQHQHDQPVIVAPDVKVMTRTASDNFIAIGCDGIFDVLSATQLASMSRERVGVHGSTSRLSGEIIQTALAKNSKDNLSVLLIELDDFYEFDTNLFQADVELDGQIQSMIEDFIGEEGEDELCLEDIYLAMLEGMI